MKNVTIDVWGAALWVLQGVVDGYRSMTFSDRLMVALTIVVVVLTALVWRLTRKVARYANRTLTATRESLDFFAKPLVRFRRDGEVELAYNPCRRDRAPGEPWQPVSSCDICIISGSPLPFFIERTEDISFRVARERSSPFAGHLLVKRGMIDTGEPLRGGFPQECTGQVRIGILFYPNHDAMPSLTAPAPVVVEARVKYTYRGRTYDLAGEFSYSLTPPSAAV